MSSHDSQTAYDFICNRPKKCATLSQEENNILVHKSHAGDKQATWDLVVHHQGLISQRVNKYGRKNGIDPEDLQQEGTFGLIRAIRNYKPELGWKFSTYAAPVIDQFIDRAVKMKADLVRKPSELQAKLVKAQRKWSEHITEEGRPPTQAELSELSDMTREELDKCKQLLMDPVSLDSTKWDEDESPSLSDVLSCSRAMPHQEIEGHWNIHQIRSLVKQLTPEEQAVISARFGLNDNESKSRAALAHKLGITETEVHRREKRGLAKLEQLTNLDALSMEFAVEKRKTAAEWRAQKNVPKKKPSKNAVIVENASAAAKMRLLSNWSCYMKGSVAVV